jgi:hypothetical protein
MSDSGRDLAAEVIESLPPTLMAPHAHFQQQVRVPPEEARSTTAAFGTYRTAKDSRCSAGSAGRNRDQMTLRMWGRSRPVRPSMAASMSSLVTSRRW